MERLTEKELYMGDVTFCCGQYEKDCDGNCQDKSCGLLREAVRRIKEYEDLEEQGKLLKLPCAVGDTVYTNCSMKGWYFKDQNRPYTAVVVFIGLNGSDNYMNVDFGKGNMLQFKFSDIGKKIFFTREEAEAAWKGGKMITLKGSRFIVSYDENSGKHNVFVRSKDGFSDITNSLKDEEKDELINDLIYCVTDLINK